MYTDTMRETLSDTKWIYVGHCARIVGQTSRKGASRVFILLGNSIGGDNPMIH